jgi:N-hydroxyarylamine O-acetyltransferase
VLAPALVERVLEKLGFDAAPTADPVALDALYEAWGQRVPWDSVRKRLYFASGGEGQLPGSTADDFFGWWLAHGTGGTCWAGSIALHGLLTALGFDVRFGAGQVQATADAPLWPVPGHGTTIVRFGGQDVIVDTSFLTGRAVPIPDDPGERTFPFAPFHDLGAKFWRIALTDVPVDYVTSWHEATRATSPFNRFLNVRRNDGDEVVGWTFGHGARILADVTVVDDDGDAVRWLVDVLGFSEEIVDQIPADEVA